MKLWCSCGVARKRIMGRTMNLIPERSRDGDRGQAELARIQWTVI